jgi:nicotinamide-nucleotide amidase
MYSTNGDSLEAVIGWLLRERNATLAIAESLTGGQLGQRITSVAGSSDYFVGGFLTYTDKMKAELLGVDPELIRRHTAVSEEVAAAMAAGARARTGADYSIATTGEAGPKSNSGAPAGTVFVGFADKDQCHAVRFVMPGDRIRVRGFATNAALDLLRRQLLGS